MKSFRIETTNLPAAIKRGEAMLLALIALAVVTSIAQKGVRVVQDCIHAEGEMTRRELSREPSAPPIPPEHGAAFHWAECLRKLESGMHDLGMTDRQVEVSIGIVRQETYEAIAKRLRVRERTIRSHASSAFQRVGCTKKADFLICVLRAIEASDGTPTAQRGCAGCAQPPLP